MNILAIESSCDETAAAVIKDGREIISNVIASSAAMHEKWGGIVPEVAAREQLKYILPVIEESLSCFTDDLQKSGDLPSKQSRNKDWKKIISGHIDAIAVTVGPGLVGSLLIGVETAKTLSFVTKKPLIPVNHVLAHMYANLLKSKIKFPAISLVVSGGHTELFLMKSEKIIQWLGGTLDDASGEAFDKTARLLGFGSRGGLAIQESAYAYASTRQSVNASTISLPRPMLHDKTLNFSFSGLKTAMLREVNKFKTTNELTDKTIQHLAYEVQESITDVLVKKTIHAALLHGARSILISGGVAANKRLREKFVSAVQLLTSHTDFYAPPVELCTDNAAYIGSCAFFRGIPTDWHDVDVSPDLSVEVSE